MTQEELAMIEKWQNSEEVHADLAIHGLGFAVDDLTDALKTREGARTIRANWHMIMESKHKLDDLVFEVDNTWRQG